MGLFTKIFGTRSQREVKKFEPIIEKIDALENEYRRWPIMENTENWALKDPYKDYDEALDSLVLWMEARYEWIDNALK